MAVLAPGGYCTGLIALFKFKGGRYYLINGYYVFDLQRILVETYLYTHLLDELLTSY